MNYSAPINDLTEAHSETVLFAGVQINSRQSVAFCLEQAAVHISQAAQSGAQIIVLPENFATLGTGQSQSVAAQEGANAPQPILSWCQQQARQHSVYLVAGTIPTQRINSPLCWARANIFDPHGQRVTHYDKIHLFDATVGDAQGQYRESDTYAAGSQVVCFDFPMSSGRQLRIGVAVCYDLRFPELFQRLRDLGAEVIVLPSAFTHTTGRAHWALLLRARAVEQGVYMLGVNQCGWHDQTRQTWGHSAWVNPWGECVAHLQEAPGIVLGRYDGELINRCRQQLPTHQHHRLL